MTSNPLRGPGASVPTASHFHKQMSHSLLTPLQPLQPHEHTSPHYVFLSQVFMWLNKCYIWAEMISSCLCVAHTGHGCGEWPGDRADDRYGGKRHGQLRLEPGGVSESPDLHTDSGITAEKNTEIINGSIFFRWFLLRFVHLMIIFRFSVAELIYRYCHCERNKRRCKTQTLKIKK